MKKSNLPIEVHDHFRKANILHGYVQKDLGEASKHALETGQHLLAAKAAIPHGSWEAECERIFDPSLRTAQFYMTFAKDMAVLPKAQNSALLMLEGTLDGAAKAARKAARPEPPPEPDPEPDSDDDAPESPAAPRANAGQPASPQAGAKPEGLNGKAAGDSGPPKSRQRAAEDVVGVDYYGKCPNCGGKKWEEDEDGVSCSKCHHPHGEPAGDVDEDRINTQRQKTVKTAEALTRAFDDLQAMKSNSEYEEIIKLCKSLVKKAREWNG